MIRTPRSFSSRAGLATQRTVAVLLAVASAALVLVAFVLPHLAGDAGPERQVRAAPAPGDVTITAPETAEAVELIETEGPPLDEQIAPQGSPQALVPAQPPTAAATALQSAVPAYEPLKFVRGEGKVEQLTPRQARERAKAQADERRKQRAEQGLPPVETSEPESAQPAPVRPKDATRRQTKYPGRGKGPKRGG